MSDYLYHGPCGVCSSSDGRAFYRGGTSYCFVCGVPGGISISPFIQESSKTERVVKLPWDSSRQLGQPGISWAGKYEVSVEQLLRHNVLWSEEKQQLIYPWYDDGGNLLAYQARNFAPSKTKYFSQGDLNALLPIYSRASSNNTLILVEDCLSAIKIVENTLGHDAMPCLGSDIPKEKITRLARFYSSVGVWLDGNMYSNAQRLADRLAFVGVSSRVIYTPLDPKEYSKTDIERWLS